MTVSKHPPPIDHPCPCCRYLVFSGPPGTDEICPICYWQDDEPSLRNFNLAEGPNRVNLMQAQRNFAEIGVSEARFKARVRSPTATDRRDIGGPRFGEALLEQIYVRLLDEGTDVFRSAPAILLENGGYLLGATEGFHADERWEFAPGAVVKVEARPLSGEIVLVAVSQG